MRINWVANPFRKMEEIDKGSLSKMQQKYQFNLPKTLVRSQKLLQQKWIRSKEEVRCHASRWENESGSFEVTRWNHSAFPVIVDRWLDRMKRFPCCHYGERRSGRRATTVRNRWRDFPLLPWTAGSVIMWIKGWMTRSIFLMADSQVTISHQQPMKLPSTRSLSKWVVSLFGVNEAPFWSDAKISSRSEMQTPKREREDWAMQEMLAGQIFMGHCLNLLPCHLNN